MTVLIVDYGMGNLASVARAIEAVGGQYIISTSPADMKKASHIILPGVGAFPDAMYALHATGWDDRLRDAVKMTGIPILGICLGMQLLADIGEEHGVTAGLGLIRGQVSPLLAHHGVRLPHVGWNEVMQKNHIGLFSGIDDSADYYFVHKYHFIPVEEKTILSMTDYCGGFVSAIQYEHVYGVQFHPEKSSKNGLQLIKNFIALR